MGGQTSKERQNPESKFSSEELKEIREIYAKLSRVTIDKIDGHEDEGIRKEHWIGHFQQYFPESACCKLWDIFYQSTHHHHGMKLKHFTEGLASMLEGSIETRAKILIHLAGGEDSVPCSSFLELYKVLLTNYFKVVSQQSKQVCDTWRISCTPQSVDLLAHFLTDEIGGGSGDRNVDVGHVESWLMGCRLGQVVPDVVFRDTFGVLQTGPGYELPGPQFPLVSQVPWDKMSSAVDLPALTLFSTWLKSDLSSSWRLLYHTGLHGESFTRLMKGIVGDGPTLLVITDTDGHVFGGFASTSWRPGPKHFGDSSCFLFSLRPQLGIYRASGMDENFLYLNSHQETLPNGLGIGGPFESPGLWLSEDFGVGHSCPLTSTCLTYKSPRLSGRGDFRLRSLEVWGLQEPERPDSDDEEEKHTSILDKDPGAKAILALINRGPVSEGLRETDPTADTPEARRLHKSGCLNN